MKKTIACLVAGVAVLTAGSAMLAAPDQTDRPGQMTKGKVWIENRGRTEAIPVTLLDVAPESSLLRVNVNSMPAVAIDRSTIVQARLTRQPWDYRVITVASGADPGSALSNAGQDGWEATGIQLPVQSGTALVMKRPR